MKELKESPRVRVLDISLGKSHHLIAPFTFSVFASLFYNLDSSMLKCKGSLS